MHWHSRAFAVAAAAVITVAAPTRRALAQDDSGGAPADTAPKPADLYEQIDRKHTMSIKLPRSWKLMSAEDTNPTSLAAFHGFFGEENKSADGIVEFYTLGQYQRAALARAVVLAQAGQLKPDTLHNEAGWAQGCVVDNNAVRWYRFVEKNGRVYEFVLSANARAFDTVRAAAETLLATATVPGEFSSPALGEGFAKKKMGDFDVTSDAEASRDGSVKKACDLLATAREVMAKAMPGKPFDASRPAAWIFQNATKFETRAKTAGYADPRSAVFNPPDRCSMVSILGEGTQGNDEAVYATGAEQYLWQYFGGSPPLWVVIGLREYAKASAIGGKKLPPDLVTRTKSAIAAGKRRLDQWFDVASSSEIKDDNQGALELFGWHAYFRVGRGAKKFKKNYDGYLQTLRDSGDPAAARKAFDGVNFDELLQDFKAWGNDWKQ